MNNPTVRTAAGDRAMPKAERRLSVNLAIASRVLSYDGHDDLNQGQVSARIPGADRFLIKPALAGFREATPEAMLTISLDPAADPDPLAPPELPLHLAIYEARADVGAIVHSHAPYSLVFGATDLELRPISHDGAYFVGRVPRFVETSNTVLDMDTGRAIARVLGDAPAAFLCNHGLLVVGKTIREATIAAGLLERAARLQLLAESSGARYRSAAQDDVDRKRAFVYSSTAIKSYWDYRVREISAADPEVGTW
jgi:L-fuculose-phosphate aldolase